MKIKLCLDKKEKKYWKRELYFSCLILCFEGLVRTNDVELAGESVFQRLYGSLYWGGIDGSGVYRLWGRLVWAGEQEKQGRHIWLAKVK